MTQPTITRDNVPGLGRPCYRATGADIPGSDGGDWYFDVRSTGALGTYVWVLFGGELHEIVLEEHKPGSMDAESAEERYGLPEVAWKPIRQEVALFLSSGGLDARVRARRRSSRWGLIRR
ncbi:hypothetical protein [Azospirillum argentinense]|uniref:hypothetical protein n=1 Tax=Azospirillum argentinense TaxID=2970906 RepID=UPI0032DF6228